MIQIILPSTHSSILPCTHSPFCFPSFHRTIILSTIQVSFDPSCHPPIHPSFHSSIHLFLPWSFTHPSIFPYIHPSVLTLVIHPSIHLSIHPSICSYLGHSPIHPSFHPSTHPSIHPSIHLSIHPSSYVPSLDHADIPWGEVPRNLGSWGCYGTVPVDTPWPQACDRQVPPLSLELRAGSEAPAL